jgi:hypothetical protein
LRNTGLHFYTWQVLFLSNDNYKFIQDQEIGNAPHQKLWSFHTLTSLQCYNENEDCEDAIVEQIATKCQKTSEYQETDEDDTTERERVTNRDARITMAGL